MQYRLFALLLAAALLLTAAGCAQEADYPLMAAAADQGNVIARVTPPEGYVAAPEMAVEGGTPEYYFVPGDPGDPTRFIYYTTGAGDPQALAEAALDSYATFYDVFRAGAIRKDTLAGRNCLRFDYTCAYPDRSGEGMVYEQTSVAYLPLDASQFIACIVSLAFDDPSGCLDAETLDARLTLALSAIDR